MKYHTFDEMHPVWQEEHPGFNYPRVTPVTLMLYRLEQLADRTAEGNFIADRQSIATLVNAAIRWLEQQKISQMAWQRVMLLVIEIDANTRG